MSWEIRFHTRIQEDLIRMWRIGTLQRLVTPLSRVQTWRRIPAGQYDILSRAGRDGFFRLEPVDSNYGDDTDDKSGRNRFRLHHPGRTLGCVAAKDEGNWNDVEKFINSTVSDEVTVPSMSRNPWGPKTETLQRFGRIVVIH